MTDKVIGNLPAAVSVGATDVFELDTGAVSSKATAAQVVAQGLVAVPDGLLATPALAFASEPGLGLYRAAAGTLGVAAGGVLRLAVSTTAVTSALPLVLPLGSPAAPALSFVGDAVKGFADGGLNSVILAFGGAAYWTWTTSTLFGSPGGTTIANGGNATPFILRGRATTDATPSITFNNLANYTGAAGALQIGTSIAFGVNQTSTASFTLLDLATTETALGSGAQLLVSGKSGAAGATQVFAVANRGGISVAAVSPAALASGNTDNYALLAGYSLARISGTDATSTIRGILAPVPVLGAILTLINVGGFIVTINHQDAGSAAANRIQTTTGAATALAVNAIMRLTYDPTSAFWRQI